jgi:AsmA-like protein
MSPSLKRILITFGAVAGFVVLVALIVPPLVGVDRYKPRVESAVSDALGMDFRIRGRLSMGLLPGFHVTIEDGHILGEQGVSVLSAKKVTLWIRLLPLLRREFRLSRLVVAEPGLSIERDADEGFNLERLRKAAPLLGVLDGARVSVSNATLRYADRRSGGGFEAIGCAVEVKRMRFAGGSGSQRLKGLSLQAELGCREFRTKNLSVSAIKIPIDVKDGVLKLDPVTMRMFGAEAVGSLRADISGPIPLYQVRCSLPGFRIEEFLEILSPNEAAKGAMDFSADLSMQGKSASQLAQTVTGELLLRGGDLTLVGNDLDAAISRFESSQSFNLVDVAGVFIAGPLGLAVTKGYGFASLFRGTGGTCRIDTLVSDWSVERGVAQAKDVALATAENRIALQGGLDFVNGRFADVSVAVIDRKGCASVRQQIHGAFGQPTVERPRFIKSLVGPALKLLRQTRRVLPSGPCEVFYSGSVPPPR